MRKKGNSIWGYLPAVVSAGVFCFVMAMSFVYMQHFSKRTSDESLLATRRAIEQGAVLCYAVEGFYPPSLKYLEDNYGIYVNTDYYIVRYETFASNVFPEIIVLERSTE